MQSSQYCHSPKTQAPYLHKENPTDNYVSLWISGKSTVWLRMTIPTIINQLKVCQMQHNTRQGSHYSAKLDCSQSHHCLQMVEQRSVEKRAFKFASRTFAYKRLARGLSRSVSAFSSFMREYLDPVVKTHQCAQYVDDIGIAANNAADFTRNIRAVFKCNRQAGLKLTIEKCHFRFRQVDILGRTISSEGSHYKLKKFNVSRTNLDSPCRKKHFSDIWVS